MLAWIRTRAKWISTKCSRSEEGLGLTSAGGVFYILLINLFTLYNDKNLVAPMEERDSWKANKNSGVSVLTCVSDLAL
jgi:hypothetical protein